MTWCPVSNTSPSDVSLCPILLPWDKKSLPIGWIPLLLMYLEKSDPSGTWVPWW
jgi:hypothetical protein